jgi:glycosyltransferase involved in cell wall biosynthesis
LAAAIICLFERPDIIHIHNIGPSLVLPLLRLGRLKTIVTYHSPNYQHSKWGSFAKMMLKVGEVFVNSFSDAVIFVSKTQLELSQGKTKIHIPNGVRVNPPATSASYLSEIGVSRNNYALAVARFVPEKGLHDLISAFRIINTDHKLVIAGRADHETEYSERLRHMAAEDDRIILTGYISGEALHQVYSHARLFVLPSHHE